MRYIIPYSFSQQNEFYKVYNTKQNKTKQKKKKKKEKKRKKNHSSTKLF